MNVQKISSKIWTLFFKIRNTKYRIYDIGYTELIWMGWQQTEHHWKRSSELEERSTEIIQTELKKEEKEKKWNRAFTRLTE